MLAYKKGCVFLIPFLTIVVNCFGQIDSTSVIVEDGYIEKMRDKLAIENSFNNEYEIFKVKTNGVTYEISPNIRTNYRIQLNYKFILAGFQFAPKLFPNNDDNESKGKTKSFNLKIKFVLKHWFATLQYSNIQGYYLKNSFDFTNVSENNFIQFPDLHYTAHEIETGFIQNSKFSYRSITSHMERQLKSTGSFIPVLKIRHYIG